MRKSDAACPGRRWAAAVRGVAVAGALVAIALTATAEAQSSGVKKRRPLPDEYGKVVMNALSEKGGEAPVLFQHWVHRTRYSCRVCHVDLGFAMQANGTEVREQENRRGFFCGACHDGKTAFGAAGTSKIGAREVANCQRCHSVGRDVPTEVEWAVVTAGLPRGRFGNGVDWEAAEEKGQLHLIDVLPGISIQRKQLEVPVDYDIAAKIETLPDIVFSHAKHAVWSGCELCHPDVFAVKRGSSKFTMQEIFAGRYCGLCHGSVAFPTLDCQRCHVKPVVPGS